jgi:hypothetical protein
LFSFQKKKFHDTVALPLEQHQIFGAIEQQVELSPDDTIQIHADEAPPECLCRVSPEHRQPAKAVGLMHSPLRLNAFEVAGRFDPLHVRR